MALSSGTPRIAMQVSRGIVVASIQVDLDDDVLAQFQVDLLDRVHQTGSGGIILDVSGLETLDSQEFAALRRVIAMGALLGAESVVVGLRPGVVASLVNIGADVDGLQAAIDLDAAFALLLRESDSEAVMTEDIEPEEAAPEPQPAPDAGP